MKTSDELNPAKYKCTVLHDAVTNICLYPYSGKVYIMWLY